MDRNLKSSGFLIDICQKQCYIIGKNINISKKGSFMPRPKRCRRICGYPDYWSFAPEGAQPAGTVPLTLDEFEAIRLIDHRRLTQMECASVMGVSRATVTAIYENARFKLADALVNGKRVRITGGAYCIDGVPASREIKEKGEDIMRIAVTYDNGDVGQHFGRTEQFRIYDISDGEIVSWQTVDTAGTGHAALAGFLRAAEVGTLICGGIGMGARVALDAAGIKLLPGAAGSADEAVRDFLAGRLACDPDAGCREHGKDHVCGHGNCCENDAAGEAGGDAK